jgi:hypothetical protein
MSNVTISPAFLAPRLVRAAVEGFLPRGINIARLREFSLALQTTQRNSPFVPRFRLFAAKNAAGRLEGRHLELEPKKNDIGDKFLRDVKQLTRLLRPAK